MTDVAPLLDSIRANGGIMRVEQASEPDQSTYLVLCNEHIAWRLHNEVIRAPTMQERIDGSRMLSQEQFREKYG